MSADADLTRIAAQMAGPDDVFLATGVVIVAGTAIGRRQCQPQWRQL
jgi:hypothetical protein